MDIKELLKSKMLTRALILAVGFLFALFIFLAGAAVGYHKATFEYRWGENYHRNFGGPGGGFMGMGPDMMNNPHGTFGVVVSSDTGGIIVEGNDKKEKRILITQNTIIHRGFETVASTSIQAGERAVIVGEPNEQGQIEAKLIRLFPADAAASSTQAR